MHILINIIQYLFFFLCFFCFKVLNIAIISIHLQLFKMDFDLKAPVLQHAFPPAVTPPSSAFSSSPMERLQVGNFSGNPEVIGIIGSGDFSRSLALRLVASGFRVVVGSRNPQRTGWARFPEEVDLLSQKEVASGEAHVVFIAVHPEFYPSLKGLSEALAGKVLVDVSNATGPGDSEQRSNAELLAEIFPQSRVVKAFNVVSAWTLQAGAQDGNRKVQQNIHTLLTMQATVVRQIFQVSVLKNITSTFVSQDKYLKKHTDLFCELNKLKYTFFKVIYKNNSILFSVKQNFCLKLF